jgi:hypothetical protein
MNVKFFKILAHVFLILGKKESLKKVFSLFCMSLLLLEAAWLNNGSPLHKSVVHTWYLSL